MTPLLQFKNDKKMTLKDLCLLLGESIRYEKALGDVLNGHRPVPTAKAMKWAERTGIHPHKLRPDMFKASHFPGGFKPRVKKLTKRDSAVSVNNTVFIDD